MDHPLPSNAPGNPQSASPRPRWPIPRRLGLQDQWATHPDASAGLRQHVPGREPPPPAAPELSHWSRARGACVTSLLLTLLCLLVDRARAPEIGESWGLRWVRSLADHPLRCALALLLVRLGLAECRSRTGTGPPAGQPADSP